MDLFTLILTCSLYSDSSIVNAIIQTGSQGDPLAISTTDVNNPGQVIVHSFNDPNQALQFAQANLDKHQDFSIGIMQIPSVWITRYRLNPENLLRPCANIATATKLIGNALEQCTAEDQQMCALSLYKSADPSQALSYAENIIQYAKEHPLTNNPKPAAKPSSPFPEEDEPSDVNV